MAQEGSMSRKVRIEAPDWDDIVGARAAIPVMVDWPELRLTEEQVLANAWALAYGERTPYPDHSMFVIEIERPRAR
jgi:hypothetical protein